MKIFVLEKRFRGHDVEEQANEWDSSYQMTRWWDQNHRRILNLGRDQNHTIRRSQMNLI